MSTHTPGPWAMCKARDPELCSCGLIWALPADGIVATVADSHDHLSAEEGFTPETRLANAHLIAAAPSLLAALEAVEWGTEEMCASCRGLNLKGHGHEKDCSLQAALLLARGESPTTQDAR